MILNPSHSVKDTSLRLKSSKLSLINRVLKVVRQLVLMGLNIIYAKLNLKTMQVSGHLIWMQV